MRANNLKEFYEEHNLSEWYFAKLIGVRVKQIHDYFNGSLTLRKDREAWLRIDIAIQFIEDYYMCFPNRRASQYPHPISINQVNEIVTSYEFYFHGIFDRQLMIEL